MKPGTTPADLHRIPDATGLLKQLTKTVLETVLNQELTEHLGH
jgi:transposase-like protein